MMARNVMNGVLAAFVVAAVPLAAQSVAGYPLVLHVTQTTADLFCAPAGDKYACQPDQVIEASVEGRYFTLRARTLLSKGVLPLGDYPASLTENETRPTGEYKRSYTVRFVNGETRVFEVIGERTAP